MRYSEKPGKWFERINSSAFHALAMCSIISVLNVPTFFMVCWTVAAVVACLLVTVIYKNFNWWLLKPSFFKNVKIMMQRYKGFLYCQVFCKFILVNKTLMFITAWLSMSYNRIIKKIILLTNVNRINLDIWFLLLIFPRAYICIFIRCKGMIFSLSL